MSTYNCKRSINGIIVQNNPVNWIDPEGEFPAAAAAPLLAIPVVGEVVAVAAVGYLGWELGKAIRNHFANKKHRQPEKCDQTQRHKDQINSDDIQDLIDKEHELQNDPVWGPARKNQEKLDKELKQN